LPAVEAIPDRPLAHQGRRLLQLGTLLLLLGLVIGLAIPALAVPRLGVAAHLNAVVGALFLLALGLLRPQLRLGRRGSAVAFWLAPYSFFTASLMPLLGGVWRAGGSMLPLAAGTARGSGLQEGVIAVGLVTAGVAILALCVLLLVGLRGSPREA
jgi:hydroxylaminobenzene mutase